MLHTKFFLLSQIFTTSANVYLWYVTNVAFLNCHSYFFFSDVDDTKQAKHSNDKRFAIYSVIQMIEWGLFVIFCIVFEWNTVNIIFQRESYFPVINLASYRAKCCIHLHFMRSKFLILACSMLSDTIQVFLQPSSAENDQICCNAAHL